ncbi:phosphodiesterase [Mycolicibacterium doricum]|uniref:Phosphodiesterase n=1 Tax=Mycolicibacterium doricum TaxID=126673 RepID=A0A1X1T305_9MYCO|nr:alkaline phosphatase family protein [Mycolicibacterium doricum]MCV7268685.1 alkaline phosphatase family protein [Mycolicibacterium doricum]ORV38686.1 phosphodiesterase [Mycolicibacterium doricum]BBZ06928.1 phosphodiesterase [Mycolicibacterium doricum]
MSLAVVFVILDGVGARQVRPETMPALHALATAGAWRPDGAQAVLCSATYPNILTLVTGRSPEVHRVFANPLVGPQFVGHQFVGHQFTADAYAPTLFELAASSSSEVVVGDQHLIDVAGARSAGRHWPPDGTLPPSAMRDEFGYAADEEVLPRAVEAAERRSDLLVVHLNGPDTAAHLHGPESARAADAYRSADATVANLVEVLRPRWDELVVLITSDHDQEPVDDQRRIDLARLATTRGVDATVYHEGTAALVIGGDAGDDRWLAGVPGIERSWLCEPGLRMVASTPHAWFASATQSSRHGAHGGPRTRDQVAIATGGHPMVSEIADRWRRRRPHAEDWTGLILAALRDGS